MAEEQTNNLPTSPLVSVIVPTYNYGSVVGEMFGSLQAQSYSHWECVVVDDGSTDDTPGIVSEFSARDPRIKYLRQQNQRQAAARNLGLKNSTGKYVQFLDADDKLEFRKLETQVAFLEAHEDVDIVYGGVHFFGSSDDAEQALLLSAWRDRRFPHLSGSGLELLPELVRQNTMVVNAPLVRRSVVDSVGSFDVDVTPAEDWDYWLRCAMLNLRLQYAEAADTRALVRVHPASTSQNLVHMFQAMLKVRDKLETSLTETRIRNINQAGKSAEEGYLGIEMASAGQSFSGIKHMIRAAVLARPARGRLKWLLCAAVTPFVSSERLRKLVVSSVSQTFRGFGSEAGTA